MSLNKTQIFEYWKDRAKIQGELTVGNGGLPIEIQNEEYRIKSDLVFSLCPTDMSTLDYGCGTGRYAKYFEYYLGVDITASLLEIAKRNNPNKNFHLLDSAIFENQIISGAHLIFTSTVLQHCADEVCMLTLKNIKKYADPKAYFFYENSVIGKSFHVSGRSCEDYKQILIACGNKIKSAKSKTHIVHGESHTASLFFV